MVKLEMLASIWKSGNFFYVTSYAHYMIQSYIETKITHDTSVEDLQSWIDRIWRDAGSHNAFADVALRVGSYHYGLGDADDLLIASVSQTSPLCLMWNL